MENITISKNGMYLLTSENVYSVVEDKTYSIDEIEMPRWLDILNENTKYSIKNNLVEIKTLASYHRRVTYQLMEGLAEVKKFNLMLEYEGKFSNLLLTENIILIENWFSDAWNWTKDKVVGAFDWVVDKVKAFGTFAIKTGKDFVACITGKGCSPLFEDFREMLYSPVGIAIETFLAVSGVGTIVPIIAWGIMGLWDVYLLISGSPDFSWLNLILDILGIGLGAIAKGFRAILGGAEGIAKTAGKGVGEVIAQGMKNPATKSVFTRLASVLGEGLGKIIGPLKKAGEFISTKLKLSWVGRAVDGFTTQVAKLMDSLGVKAGKEATSKFAKNASGKFQSGQARNVAALKTATGQGLKHGTIAKGIMVGAESDTGQKTIKKIGSVFGGGAAAEENTIKNLKSLSSVEPVAGVEF